jgi:hypothetical protein
MPSCETRGHSIEQVAGVKEMRGRRGPGEVASLTTASTRRQSTPISAASSQSSQELKARRRHVESAGWNRICCQVSRDITDVMDPDAELMAAIEAFHHRQLARIDAATRGIRH